MYPEETLRARYDYEELTNLADASSLRYSDASLAAKEHCIRTHEYSSRSGEFLFDLPDIDSPPAVHPVGFAGDAGSFFIDLFYNPWFADVRNRPYNVLKKSALRDAIAFEGFRFGISLFLRMPALYAAAFFTGRGVMLCVGSVPRSATSSPNGGSRPEAAGWALTTLLAVVVSVLRRLLATRRPARYPRGVQDDLRGVRQYRGRVFDLSQVDAIRDYIATILLLVAGFAIVWELFQSGTTRPQRAATMPGRPVRGAGMSGILLLLVFGLLLEAIVCSQISIDSGFNLQENVLEGTAGSTSVQTDMLALENDVYFFHVAIAHAAVIGIFTTLFAVAGPVARALPRPGALALRHPRVARGGVCPLCAHADALGEHEHGQPRLCGGRDGGARHFARRLRCLRCLHSLPHGVGAEAQEDDAKQEATKRSPEAPVGDSSLAQPQIAKGLGFKVRYCSRCSCNARL